MDFRILIADDDTVVREALVWLFRAEGYPVLEAENGMQALAALRASDAPVVVVLDYHMPVLDGAGVLAAMAQADDLAHHHAYLFYTAGSRTLPPAVNALLQTVGATLVPKPFDVDALLTHVERACEELEELKVG